MASNAAHFFASVHKLSHITECHSLLLLLRTPLFPPSLPPSPTPPLQICVGKNEEIDGFLRLSSGKKRGLVPVTYLLEI